MSASNETGPSFKRTHYCGELRAADEGREVVLCGWVHKTRDMGHLVFVDVRDREGLVQVVFQSDRPELAEEAKKLRNEFVVGVRGRVRHRSAVNKDIPTGEVEVEATGLRVFAASKVPPFVVADPPQASEELRLKYRYLDLRRPKMQRQIRLRHEAALAVRNYMSGNGYLEIETPILANPTPEGARDFLVPSRMYKGRFYALPQSPQQFKQTLMVSGLRPLFPDRPLLPRRGPPGRPPARVHPDRHRDELHRPRRLLRPQRRAHGGPVRARRPEGRAAVPAPALRRGHGEVRLGQARPPGAARDEGPDRRRGRDGLGDPQGRRRRGRRGQGPARPRGRLALARPARQARRQGQVARGQRPRLDQEAGRLEVVPQAGRRRLREDLGRARRRRRRPGPPHRRQEGYGPQGPRRDPPDLAGSTTRRARTASSSAG